MTVITVNVYILSFSNHEQKAHMQKVHTVLMSPLTEHLLSTDTDIHITKFFPCFLPPFQTGDSPTHRNVGPLKRSSERALPKLLSTWVYSWQAGIRECQLPLESYFDYLLLLIIFWLSIRVCFGFFPIKKKKKNLSTNPLKGCSSNVTSTLTISTWILATVCNTLQVDMGSHHSVPKKAIFFYCTMP